MAAWGEKDPEGELAIFTAHINQHTDHVSDLLKTLGEHQFAKGGFLRAVSDCLAGSRSHICSCSAATLTKWNSVTCFVGSIESGTCELLNSFSARLVYFSRACAHHKRCRVALLCTGATTPAACGNNGFQWCRRRFVSERPITRTDRRRMQLETGACCACEKGLRLYHNSKTHERVHKHFSVYVFQMSPISASSCSLFPRPFTPNNIRSCLSEDFASDRCVSGASTFFERGVSIHWKTQKIYQLKAGDSLEISSHEQNDLLACL